MTDVDQLNLDEESIHLSDPPGDSLTDEHPKVDSPLPEVKTEDDGTREIEVDAEYFKAVKLIKYWKHILRHTPPLLLHDNAGEVVKGRNQNKPPVLTSGLDGTLVKGIRNYLKIPKNQWLFSSMDELENSIEYSICQAFKQPLSSIEAPPPRQSPSKKKNGPPEWFLQAQLDTKAENDRILDKMMQSITGQIREVKELSSQKRTHTTAFSPTKQYRPLPPSQTVRGRQPNMPLHIDDFDVDPELLEHLSPQELYAHATKKRRH